MELSLSERVAEKIGYKFANENLLILSLTHSSASSKENNERLEFLGDSLLGLIISEQIFSLHPNLGEGELTRLRSALVKGETLSSLLKGMDVTQFVILGDSIKNNVCQSDKFYANFFEALLGAIYLDSNLEVCRKLILKWFDDLLKQTNLQTEKDNKSLLQEYLLCSGHVLPSYRIVCKKGPDHDKLFEVECLIKQLNVKTTGFAKTRKGAEQVAAGLALLKLKQ